MDFTIIPYEGLGPIRFGMSRTEVCSALGVGSRAFKKAATSVSSADAFDQIGVHVHYSPSGACEAVEVAAPSQVVFNGETLIGRSFSEVKRVFERVDPNLQVDGAGFTSTAMGVGIFAPSSQKSPESVVEGVIAFAKGYYD